MHVEINTRYVGEVAAVLVALEQEVMSIVVAGSGAARIRQQRNKDSHRARSWCRLPIGRTG